MNNAEINEVKELIALLKQYNFAEQFLAAYPDQDLSQVVIDQDYTVQEVIPILSRLILQFEDALNSDFARHLPYRIAVPGFAEFQNSWRITDALNMLRDAMPRPEAVKSVGVAVQWLVYYQIFCGFWDKSERKLHHVDEVKLREQQQQVELMKKRVSRVLDKAEEVARNHEHFVKLLEELIRTKNEEFLSLANMVGKATNETSQITQLWEQAHRQKGEFDNLISQANQSLDSVRLQKNEQQKEFGDVKSSLSLEKEKLEDVVRKALEELEYIDQSKDAINERINEAKRLLGLSADAALGGKFSLRERKVSKSLVWWRVAVGATVAVAVTWSVVVFLCLATRTSLPYLDIIVNLVKTSPGFILMGYVMAQYNKERAIEEEYAFRSAISETINAYADLLEGYDGTDSKNVSRQTMLLDSIKQVYAKPQMHKENVRARDYKNASAELMEVLKGIVSNK